METIKKTALGTRCDPLSRMVQRSCTTFHKKKGYADDPCFKNAKVVYSVYDELFEKPFNQNTAEKLRFDGIGDPEIEN